MKTVIRKMGHSQGILIPTSLLMRAGLEIGEVDIAVENNAIVIRKLARTVRQGWAEASKAIAVARDDGLVWQAFDNEGDHVLVW